MLSWAADTVRLVIEFIVAVQCHKERSKDLLDESVEKDNFYNVRDLLILQVNGLLEVASYNAPNSFHSLSKNHGEEIRLQLKSTLVDRIIRDLGLIPPDHVVIKEGRTLWKQTYI